MSDVYHLPLTIRWSDLDPNFHVRHSVYYDWGAYCRITYLEEQQLGQESFMKYQIGPILFREEAIFRREIRMGESLRIDLNLLKARRDHSRWSIRHQLIREDESIAAIITVDGAWMNMQTRKLATAPEIATTVFNNMPRDSAFSWL